MIEFLKFTGTGIRKAEADGYDWVNVILPTEKEKDFLINELKIPEGFYNDIEDINERPRIEEENGWYFVLLRIPYKEILKNGRPFFYTVPLAVIFNNEKVVTICFFNVEMIGDFIQYTQRKGIDIRSNQEFLIRLFISSSVWYSKYLKQLNIIMNSIEKNLQDDVKDKSIRSLFKIEKSIIYFNATLSDHSFLLKRLHIYTKIKDVIDEDLWEDAEIELMQALTTSRIYRDILKRLEEAYDQIISSRLNEVMKRLTAISIILMIPTLIASFYGMNVPNGLEKNTFAFAGLVVLSLIFSWLGYIFFRKRDWF